MSDEIGDDFELPLYLVAREFTVKSDPPASFSLRDVSTLKDRYGNMAVALFTSEFAAEQFRDFRVPDRQVFGIATSEVVVLVLGKYRDRVTGLAAMNPTPFRQPVRVESLDRIIRFHDARLRGSA